MTRNSDIFERLCEFAPLEDQMDFDNAGFLLGRHDDAVKQVLLALDITDEVVDEAITAGCTLIVTHHPLIWTPLKSLTDSTPENVRIMKLLNNGVAVISMHTNLDIAEGGVNDVLLSLLGAERVDRLDSDGCGRVGFLKSEMPLSDFLPMCKHKLNANGLRYYDAQRPVNKIAVMGGAGGGSVKTASEKGCDTYITADIGYHKFLEAMDFGINLIDADHFCTENPMIAVLRSKLAAAFGDVTFTCSSRHHQIVSFI